MRKNKLLLHTDSFPHMGLDHIFEFAKKMGFDGLEVGINQNIDTQDPAYLQVLEKRHKIKIQAFSLTPKNEESLTEAFERVVLEFPKTTVNVIPPKNFSFAYKKWFTGRLPRIAQKAGVELCYKNSLQENMMGFIPSRNSNSLEALMELGAVCLDLSALAAGGQEIMKTIPYLGKNLRHVTISNVYREIPYAPIEKGVLPLESFLSKLAHNKFTGNFSVLYDERFWKINQPETKAEVAENTMNFFKKYFDKGANKS